MPTEGDVLNHRYQILRVLSDKGGMGVVYEAKDLKKGYTVVIKQSRFSSVESLRQNQHYRHLTQEQLCEEAEFLRKTFKREAQMLFGLRHKALPQVFNYFEIPADNQGDQPDQFVVMEFIAGQDFDDLLKQNQGPFPLAEVLDWADQILDALDYLHTQFDEPIIHRDINPRNLKLKPNGQVVLLDFGLAKGAHLGMATPGVSVPGGSVNYAPLEQLDEKGATDERSDLYSLAMTLHHLLTGQNPPGAATRAGKVLNNQLDPLRPLHEFSAQIPPPISVVLQRAAALNQAERYTSAAAMREALRRAVTAAPPPRCSVATGAARTENYRASQVSGWRDKASHHGSNRDRERTS